jgi:hypothetical protein
MTTQDIFLQLITTKPDSDGSRDVTLDGVRVAHIYKGWSRNGGMGWVASVPGLQDIHRAHKTLTGVKRAIAFRIHQSTGQPRNKLET